MWELRYQNDSGWVILAELFTDEQVALARYSAVVDILRNQAIEVNIYEDDEYHKVAQVSGIPELVENADSVTGELSLECFDDNRCGVCNKPTGGPLQFTCAACLEKIGVVEDGFDTGTA